MVATAYWRDSDTVSVNEREVHRIVARINVDRQGQLCTVFTPSA